MRLNRPIKKRPPETIVALVDVVFFLLVFALLIGHMDATAPFNVAPPTAITGTDMPAGGMTVSVSAKGALALDGQATAYGEVLTATENALARDPGTRLRINADGTTTLKHVLPLVEALSTIGATDIVLVVTPGAG